MPTCNAHSALASAEYASVDPAEHPEVLEVLPSGILDGYAVRFSDASELHIDPSGWDAVTGCDCDGTREESRDGILPGGYWTRLWLDTPRSWICDLCGYMCECCRECLTAGGCYCGPTVKGHAGLHDIWCCGCRGSLGGDMSYPAAREVADTHTAETEHTVYVECVGCDIGEV